MRTGLAFEALHVIHISSGPHNHFKGWYLLITGRAQTCRTKHPEVIAFTEYEIGFSEECGSNLPEPAVTTGTLETVLVPQLVQCFEEIPFPYGLMTRRALRRRLRRVGRHLRQWLSGR